MIGPMCLAFLVLQQISEPKDIAALKMLRTAGRLGLRTTSVVWSKPAPFILQRCSAHTSLFPIKTGNCDVSLWRGLSSAAKPPEPVKSIVEARGGDLVLSPPALVVTREFEWGNIVLGFEQANKYTIRAAPGGEVVGYIAEVRFCAIPLLHMRAGCRSLTSHALRITGELAG